MTCPKNKKKWWVFSWQGKHDWRDLYIPVRLNYWIINIRCNLCGSQDEIWPLDDLDMVRRGYVLNKLPTKGYFGKNEEDCR